MSIQVTGWALKGAQVGDAVAKLVLLALASHANDDGTSAWPSQRTIAAYAEVTVRTVRTKLEYLQEKGLIRPGNEQVVSHLPANRRPQVWDLNITGAWAEILSSQEDLREENLSSQNAPLGGNLRSSGGKTVSYKLSVEERTTEVSLRSTSAQDLVAEWIDHCNGGRPPGRVVGQVAKEVAAMLTEGIPYDDVRQGLAQWHLHGLHPSALASVVHEIRNPKKINGAKHLAPAEDNRSRRLRATPDPDPPPDLTPAEYQTWLRAERRRIAAGKEVS